MRRPGLSGLSILPPVALALLAAAAFSAGQQAGGRASTPAATASVAEIGVLTESNFDRLAPQGKEADAIYGDYVLRNDRIVAVIGNPIAGRNANSSALGVGGSVIDLTLRDHPDDLLGVFYPGGGHFLFTDPRIETPRGAQVRLTCVARARPASATRPATPEARLTYSLKAGEPFLTVATELVNTSPEPIEIPIEDALRVDGPSFDKAPDGQAPLVWAYDRWFGQAYGVAADGIEARVTDQGKTMQVLWLAAAAAQDHLTLQPGQSFTLTRRIFPAADLVGVRAIEASLRGAKVSGSLLEVTDPSGHPVSGADVALSRAGLFYARTRTARDGRVRLDLPPGAYHAEVSSLGMGSRALDLDPQRDAKIRVALDAGSRLLGKITDAGGSPIPSKVIITGVEGTPTPDFGPEDAAEQIKNLIYTPDGTFSRVLPAGSYEVIASHGPEFDIVTRRVEIPAGGAEVRFDASLAHSVKTPGWVSADFHGHTTASGDTAASRRGRVLNLAAEQIEFAPSTEHNRLDNYDNEIRELGLARFIKSCTGLELTGEPFLVNHQNAFPLRLTPHTQNSGGPEPDPDPVAQIRRLALWDDSSEKLVEQNHPDIGWIRYDRDGDGTPDGGFAGMFPYQEAIEVWGDDILKMQPFEYRQAPDPETGQLVWVRQNNPIFNWLQLLNQGVRLPAVANTDAHTNFHGSGGRRNYVRCSTDDPERIDPLEIVRQAEKGHIIITNGPYLEVSLTASDLSAAGRVAIPGDEIAAPGGHVTLKVRVQCPNWFDIDRVQFLLNGRVAEDLGRTRYNNPREFGDGPVKFDKEMKLTLKSDTHIIVVAWHKLKPLATVMGPAWGDFHPTAISNPIFVDVDGNGFVANGDTLGHPLPVKGGQIVPGPPPPPPPAPPAQTSSAPASPPR